MSQNDPVVMVSIEDTRLHNGTINYSVFCWRHVSDCFELDTFTDEREAMRAALKVGVPVVRWMGWAKRDQFIAMCDRRAAPPPLVQPDMFPAGDDLPMFTQS